MDLRSHGASVAALRDHNLALVLRRIIGAPGSSRTEIAARIGLTDAAVSRITRDLIEAGLVREGKEVPGGPGQRGRRQVQLAPDGNGAAFVAVSLTISDRRVSIVDLAGRRRAEAALPLALPRQYPRLVDDVVAAIRGLLARTRIPRQRVLGLAVATAGAVEQGSGRVAASSLSVLEGRSPSVDLTERLRIPGVVETIGNTFGLAEAHRAMRDGGDDMAGASLVVHVAFGLGISVMLDGQPIRTGGDERTAGHVPVAGGTGRCVCGARGCLMAEAAGYGILRRLSGLSADAPRQGWDEMRPEVLRDAVARAADPPVAETMSAAGDLLGERLFDIASVLAPRRILLGGPLAGAPAFVAGIEKGLSRAHARVGTKPPPLRVSVIDYLQATELLAIEEFVLRRPLALATESAA
ncbi:ROK family transcriptional regulator [Roseomonas sp. PWR1]|uniref:ROK family transcriptional regulator n=1 Tax=Roseomonas nitratireducens TaxID=2820810 RepID=A0ABS4AVH7_9PROT|nr:ROK family transcriptional regulator [Neoroseomonas nitratireducens]MBP0465380.1 ROK family transcriptional regulator [Neoroseomonas nitratireducens]